jgi:hypothetical protein
MVGSRCVDSRTVGSRCVGSGTVGSRSVVVSPGYLPPSGMAWPLPHDAPSRPESERGNHLPHTIVTGPV